MASYTILTKDGADDLYAPLWQPSTAYAINAPVLLPNGKTAVRTAAGTSRAQFDATEEALWTVTGGGATTVDALTDASPVGKAVAKAVDAPAARTILSAAPSSNIAKAALATAVQTSLNRADTSAQAIDVERGRVPAFMVGSYYGSWGAGDDTAAIANAIDAAVQAGGGRVIIPFTGAYVPKASQVTLPRWVHFSGSSWNSFGASGNVGRLQQLSGVNADFINFSANGFADTRPFIGPQSVTDLVIRAAPGSTAGHGIAGLTPDGRTALVQDFTTFQRLNIRGFAGSGMFFKGGSPIIIEDVATLWNGGYGLEFIDPHVDLNNYSIHHLILSKISGDGNMGYLADEGGATVYIKGMTSSYGCSLHGIKSEYRIRPASDSGNDVQMGNAHAIILDDCESQIDVSGVTHIATGSQTRKPKAPILVKGTKRPNLSWAGVGVRGAHPLQTVGVTPPVVQDDVDQVPYTVSRGSLGPQVEAATRGLVAGESTIDRRAITSTGATVTAGTLRLTYFTAEKTETISGVRTLSGTTAAVGTTLARIGIWEVDAAGVHTLVASTANDPALWSVTSVVYGKNFTAPFVKRRNRRYALGLLVVGATTNPNVLGQSQLLASEAAQPPRLCGSVSGQTDLPTTIAASSVSDTTIQIYGALVP